MTYFSTVLYQANETGDKQKIGLIAKIKEQIFEILIGMTGKMVQKGKYGNI